MKWIHRIATRDDAKAAMGIVRSSIETICAPYYQNNNQIIEKWLANKTEGNFQKWIEDSQNISLISLDQASKPVGFCLASVNTPQLQEGIIRLCYVAPDHIKKGVGTQLAYGIENLLSKSSDTRKINLNSSLSAINFYLKLGYEAIYFDKTQPMSLKMIKNLSY